MSIVYILIYCLANFVLGICTMLLVPNNFFSKAIDKLGTFVIVFGGLTTWILYGLYSLIKLPKQLKETRRTDKEEEYERFKESIFIYIMKSNIQNTLQALLYDCEGLYYRINYKKYKYSNEIRGYKFEGVFLATINCIKELEEQYGSDIFYKNNEEIYKTLSDLKEYLTTTLQEYEREYSESTVRDTQTIKNKLEDISKRITSLSEINKM